MSRATQTRRITISVDTKGNREIKDLADKMGMVSRNTKSLAGNLSFLTNVFTGYLSSLGIRELARMSDEMQNLSNRLKIVSREGEDTNVIMAQLLGLADRTNQSIGNVAEVYNRLGSSLKAANAGSGALLEITEGLINSFRISGSTGNETAATIIQLSQAFASGTLRGQELRSVLLQNAELARLLRERFGKNLAKDAEAGLISVVEVLKLLRQNQARINEQAKLLAPTFEQVLTKAFNQASFALFNLNEQFRLSGRFASLVQGIIDRLQGIGIAAALLASTQIPRLIASLRALGVAFGTFAATNPFLATLTAISILIVATNGEIDRMADVFRSLYGSILQVELAFRRLDFTIQKTVAKGFSKIFGGVGRDTLNELGTQLDVIKSLEKEIAGLKTPSASRPSPLDPNADAKKQEEEFNKLIEKLEKLYGQQGKAQKIREVLAEINQEYLRGAIGVEQYNDKLIGFELYRLNREFAEGRFDIFRYNERLRELQEQDLNRYFQIGAVSFSEFNDKLSNLRIAELNAQFRAGRITLTEYNQELVNVSRNFEPGSALTAGTASYLNGVGTLSSNIADGIRDTFTALEDSLLEFIKRGRFNFAQFTQAILDDLTRIIIRASIIRPLAEAIIGGGVGSSGAGTSTSSNGFAGGFTGSATVNATGNVYDKGLRKFAKGGIVNAPTLFGYGGGTGLMGEAGPEAILPLRRGKGGDLGVQATVTPVTVNIINQSNSQVEQRETTGPNGEKTIEVLIFGKVREGLASGQFDKVMKQSYGLNRRGL